MAKENPIIKIVDCTTGEEIQRPMTDEEVAIYLPTEEVSSEA